MGLDECLQLKRVEFGYDTFLNYVNRQIRHVLKKKSVIENTLPEFTFNPEPNREDLI